MMINDNKEDLRQKIIICHKLVNDRGKLAMMYGIYEEPWLSAIACWRIIMACTCYRVMDTHCW